MENTEDYIYPGRETLMWVNAYKVTRQYGGPEEGGWWYNDRSPLTSIPIKAISIEGHDNGCYRCKQARQGAVDETGKPYTMCKRSCSIVPIDEKQAKKFIEHLQDVFSDVNDGDIYSVLGGSKLSVCLETNIGSTWMRPKYE
jgi:hypothetical protein